MRSKRTVLYIRVSSEEQAREGVSLADQETRLKGYSLAMNLGAVEVVRDEGWSAKSLRRPGVEALLSAVRKGEVAAVVVAKLDRLTRSRKDLEDLLALFASRGVALHSLGERLDTSSASGRFFIAMLGALAALEREQVGERTSAAMGHLKMTGKTTGSTPYGWRLAADGSTLEALPEEQEVLADMRAMRGAGRSLRFIAGALTARNVPTKRGGRWSAETVRSTLKSAEGRPAGAPAPLSAAAA